MLRRIERDKYRVSRTYRGVMEPIVGWIRDPDFNMSKAWEKAGLSPRYTSALAIDLGVKPAEYLRDRRMEIIAFLFLDPSLDKITHREIVAHVGFEYKTFGENFPKWCGQTATEFRQNPCPRIVEHLRQLENEADNGAPEPTTTVAHVGFTAGFTAAYAEVVESVADEKLAQGQRAAVTGHFETALDLLPRALDTAEEHHLSSVAATAHAYLGYAFHQRAAEQAESGRVDDAWGDLAAADQHYLAAGRLPHRLKLHRARIAVSHDPRAPLLEALCHGCRGRLLGASGRDLRDHLDHALELVHRDLPWFHDACQTCCQRVWDAIHKARLGLLDNAWHAVWLAHFADPLEIDATPSLGRFIALLHDSERITFGDQDERAEICRQAVDVAIGLRDPVREALARLHYGNALRAMGRHKPAAAELDKAEKSCQDVPWLRAFFCFVTGSLELQLGQSESAFVTLDKAFRCYEDLDPHVAGLVRILVAGDLYCSNHRYTEALEEYAVCESLIDGRRTPLILQATLPINLAAAFSGLGEWGQAQTALARCDYDRAEHPGLLAMERVNQACIELGRGRPREALPVFAEAKALCEGLHRWLEAGMVALYAIEAYVAVNERLRAIESCADALRIFRQAGCDRKTEQTLARLGKLLEPLAVDLTAIAVCVRQLARRYGGYLPVSPS